MNGHDAGCRPPFAEQDRPFEGLSCERVRAFVAVLAPSDLHKACNRLAEKGRGLLLRWVRPESLHLTLRFWGDLRTDVILAVCDGLQRAAQASVPFHVEVRGLCCFPNADRPRVLWMGLEDPQHQLVQLRRRIDASLADVGVPPEVKPFRPHLTVARARKTPGRGILDAFLGKHGNQAFGRVAVAQVHLMRSDLTGKGAVHTCLQSFPLQGQQILYSRPLKPPEHGNSASS